VDRRETFRSDDDRTTYLGLLQDTQREVDVSLLAWCLMTNHVHLVAVPGREDALSVLLRRVHGRYAQYYNARWGRTGHLWQSRFFACPLGPDHLRAALAYVERNPVRAGIVAEAAEYRWSSATAHVQGQDPRGLLDMDWWRQHAPQDWERTLQATAPTHDDELRDCTYAGRPFGAEDFVAALEQRFGRRWRPRSKPSSDAPPPCPSRQLSLF
jgi:putative transposase